MQPAAAGSDPCAPHPGAHPRGREASPAEPCAPGALRAIVEAHRPGDRREARAKDRFLVELGRLPRPCDRHAALVHVTGSGIVVGPRGTVLHLHRRLRRWLQPGGHVEPGEGPAEAALRESVEETGLDLDHPPGGPSLVHLDVHPAAEDHTHLDLRYVLLAGTDEDPHPQLGESQQARWYGWAEAERVADPALGAGLRRGRAWAGALLGEGGVDA